GRKLDIIAKNPKCCFTVSSYDGVRVGATACEYGAYFMSAVVNGTAFVVEDTQKKIDILNALTKKYAPPMAEYGEVTAKNLPTTAVIGISTTRISAKGRKK
ncbi:MAG: pyridoxamine 5'-phosphate oxidase family protein, partial [bacterium]|nr:pyridoxamine 5'-phosphate oxidase family protein [bacterium]